MAHRILIFQHSIENPPGTTVPFLTSRKIPFQILNWDKPTPIEDLKSYTGLIILGGSQNVDEEKLFPWLVQEKELIRQFLQLNKPTLGLCLGAQLIAEILGADVRRHVHAEAGWHNVELEPKVSPLIPAGVKSLPFFHWHAYRFETPNEAKKFAGNHITADQGFVYRDNVVAVQFHPESDWEWVQECARDPEYPQGLYSQDPESLLKSQDQLPAMTEWYFQLLNNLFGGL